MEKTELKLNTLYNGDCLEFMKSMPDKSVDLVLTDPPYGTTGLEWDKVPNLPAMWKELDRILKPDCTAVMFASPPFTNKLINSNAKNYKYQWVWNKKQAGNIMIAAYQPLKITEDVLVFYKKAGRYYPIMRIGEFRTKGGAKRSEIFTPTTTTENNVYYPTNILEFSNANKTDREHPTAKPIELMKYLVETYSLKDETIFDPFAGSGSTLVAAKMLNRNYIGCEISPEYCKIAEERLKSITKSMF